MKNDDFWYYIVGGHGTMHLATKTMTFLTEPRELACGILVLIGARRWRLVPPSGMRDGKKCRKCEAAAVARRLHG